MICITVSVVNKRDKELANEFKNASRCARGNKVTSKRRYFPDETGY